MTATPPKSDEFRIERSKVIAAAPQDIFALIEDFQNWARWSPYEKLDPKMARTFSSPSHGKGASYAWESKGRGGVGRMEILEVVPTSKVVIELVFAKPMKTRNEAQFVLVPQGRATRVTWIMTGRHTALSKLMHKVLGLDKMIGRDFEAGLADLKAAAEGQSVPA
jgi:uncharacterized protein YndB with AHSA1/START domain